MQNAAETLNTPAEAFRFIVQNEATMRQYHEAQRILIRNHGDNVLLFRDHPKQSPEICISCGGYGHNSKKKCAMRTDETMTPRAKLTHPVHFAQNIERFTGEQKEGLLKAVDLQEWESQKLQQQFSALLQRQAEDKLPIRMAPSHYYLLHGDTGAKNKELDVITPSIPLLALAPFSAEQLRKRVSHKLFMDAQNIGLIKRAWDSIHFDTSDFDANYEWIEFAANEGLSLAKDNEDRLTGELLKFARKRAAQSVQAMCTTPVVAQVKQEKVCTEQPEESSSK